MTRVHALILAGLLSAVLTGPAAAANAAGARITPAKAKAIRQQVEPKARNGDANAQYNMGVLYANGYGVDKNLDTAMQWYQKAADQHQAKAELNIGIMYAKGQGVVRDMDEAARWFTRAARDGEAAAQNNLAVLYARGDGLPKDLGQAAIWAARAARAGNAAARDNLAHILGRLPRRYSRSDRVAVRSQPNDQTHVVDRLANNASVVQVDRRDGWSHVLLPTSQRAGWVRSERLSEQKTKAGAGLATTGASQPDDAEKAAADNAKRADKDDSAPAHASKKDANGGRGHAVSGAAAKRVVAASSVNVHDEPRRSAKVVFQVKRGTKITVERSWRSWRFARFPNGETGWIAGYLLAG